MSWERWTLPQQAPANFGCISDWWEATAKIARETQRRDFNSSTIYIMWNLWKERNRRNFENKLLSAQHVAGRIKEDPVQCRRVLVFFGEEDTSCPRQKAFIMHRHIHGCDFVAVNGSSSHIPFSILSNTIACCIVSKIVMPLECTPYYLILYHNTQHDAVSKIGMQNPLLIIVSYPSQKILLFHIPLSPISWHASASSRMNLKYEDIIIFLDIEPKLYL
jgi:hypothetical protein